jgi:PTH1 family peptidyl-tRNA hydrolase
MNRSGTSVQAAMNFFKLQHEEMLIICDDMNLPTARLRFRARGSSGGQKGLEDIIQRLGTEEFARLRIGIGPPPPGRDACQYVLSRFTPEEANIIGQAIEQARDGVRDWSTHGIDYCMNQYNAS